MSIFVRITVPMLQNNFLYQEITRNIDKPDIINKYLLRCVISLSSSRFGSEKSNDPLRAAKFFHEKKLANALETYKEQEQMIDSLRTYEHSLEMYHINPRGNTGEFLKQISILTGTKLRPTVSDPIAASVVDLDRGSLKVDIDSSMNKCKSKILEIIKSQDQFAQDIKKSLSKGGVDQLAYSPISYFKRDNLLDLLTDWEPSWSIEATSALFIDMSKCIRKILDKNIGEKLIMNTIMESSRVAVRLPLKIMNRNCEWVRNLPENTKVCSGVSGTIGHLLRVLSYLNVTTDHEVEAILNGAICFWQNSTVKKLTGLYHTPAEVWATYNYYLEGNYKQRCTD